LHIEAHGIEQDVVVFASVPLTDEGWVALARGEVLTAACGRLAASPINLA
jgi:predicted glutamine amidotransferase